jgi:iron complex outermembrane receptor protein
VVLFWGIPADQCKIDGLMFKPIGKISKQHDFALAYVNGKNITNKESLIDIPPLNESNKIQFAKNGME